MAHSVTLTWTDSVNPAGTVYNVYRIPPGASTPTKIASGLTVKTFTDSDPSLTIGNYTYQVTSVDAGIESAPASVVVNVPPAAPTGLTATAS